MILTGPVFWKKSRHHRAASVRLESEFKGGGYATYLFALIALCGVDAKTDKLDFEVKVSQEDYILKRCEKCYPSDLYPHKASD